MLDQVVIGIFYAAVASTMIFGVINNLRSNFYDIRQTKLRRQRQPFARQLRKRPVVNVVVFAHNDAETITDCLDALTQSSYKKLNIVVVDNASKDSTVARMRKFKKDHPRPAIRIVAKRARSSRPQALLQASKYVSDSLVLVIDGGTTVNKQTIKNSVLLHLQTAISAILLNVHIEHGYKLLGLSSKLRGIAAIRAKKSGGFIVPFDSYNYATVYTSSVFKYLAKTQPVALDDVNALRQSYPQLRYDSYSLVIAQRPAINSAVHLSASRYAPVNITSYTRSMLSLIEPLLACFMVYVAIVFNESGYILLGWMCFTFLLVLAIWSDDSRGFFSKLQLSLLALVSYGLYVLQSILSLLRLLYNSRYAATQR